MGDEERKEMWREQFGKSWRPVVMLSAVEGLRSLREPGAEWDRRWPMTDEATIAQLCDALAWLLREYHVATAELAVSTTAEGRAKGAEARAAWDREHDNAP